METVVLTYEEAAARLNIKVNSVRQRVVRRKWRTIKGNDGKVRIEIPVEEVERAESAKPEPEQGPSPKEQIAALTATVAGLERLVEAERRNMDNVQARAEAEKRRADLLESELMKTKEQLQDANRPWWKRRK